MARYVLYREDGSKLDIGDEVVRKHDGATFVYEGITRLPFSDVVMMELSRPGEGRTVAFHPAAFNLTVDIDG